MKRTIGTLATMILLFSAYSCSKDSGSTATLGTNQASFGGTTEDFSAYTSYARSSPNSISFKGGTSATSNTGDNINLSLTSRSNNLTAGTYRLSNSASFSISAKVGNSNYYTSGSDTTNTITINSIDSTSINGSYNAIVYSQSDSLKMSPKSLSGNFKY